MNKWILTGRIAKDIELTASANGRQFARITVASQETKDKANFFVLTAFGKTAENIAKYCKKGSAVELEAHLQNDNYTRETKGIFKDNYIIDVFHFGLVNKPTQNDTSNQEPLKINNNGEDFEFDLSDEDLPF